MKKLIIKLVLVVSLLAMAGCQTVKGFGGDLQDASDMGKSAIQRYAENQ